jgi:hypothetical protein
LPWPPLEVQLPEQGLQRQQAAREVTWLLLLGLRRDAIERPAF